MCKIIYICIVLNSCALIECNKESEKSDSTMIGCLIEPKRPIGLPEDAQWMGSYDTYGTWFMISKPSAYKYNEYLITCFLYYQNVEIDKEFEDKFILEPGKVFDIKKQYFFIDISSHEKCTIIQNRDTLLFINEEYNAEYLK